MNHLLPGYRRFRDTSWPAYRATFERLAAAGQRPHTVVVACSDSRVDPSLIFDAGPGELFVVRNVANLVPPYAPDGNCHGTSAALEFGVVLLEAPNLVVLGHGLCGGVQALLAPTGPPGDFLPPWIRLAARARAGALACDDGADPGCAQEAGEHAVVRLSLENLLTFPWVAERAAAGRLRLHGAHFDVRTGVLATLGADGRFSPTDTRTFIGA